MREPVVSTLDARLLDARSLNASFIHSFVHSFIYSFIVQVVGALKNCYDVLLSVGEVGDEADVDDELFAGEGMLDIEFRNVSFSHPDGWTMRDISFKMPAGTTTALVR